MVEHNPEELNPDEAPHEPEPEHEKFEWRGVKFVWQHGSWAAFKVRYPDDAGFNAHVYPRGRFWDAKITIAAVNYSSSGSNTVIEALNAAAFQWVMAQCELYEKLGIAMDPDAQATWRGACT